RDHERAPLVPPNLSSGGLRSTLNMGKRPTSLAVRLSMRMNRVVDVVLRSRVHWLLSRGLTLITVTGRRTGRRYTIPVGYLETSDAVVVLVGDAPSKTWWRNYLHPGPIEVRLHGV